MVSVRSRPGIAASSPTSTSRSRRSSGSPPVSRIFCTPSADEHAGDPLDLLEREQLASRHEAVVAAEDLLRHAVRAAEVAAVGDRDAQIAERPAEGVEHVHLGERSPRVTLVGVSALDGILTRFDWRERHEQARPSSSRARRWRRSSARRPRPTSWSRVALPACGASAPTRPSQDAFARMGFEELHDRRTSSWSARAACRGGRAGASVRSQPASRGRCGSATDIRAERRAGRLRSSPPRRGSRRWTRQRDGRSGATGASSGRSRG